MILAGITVVLTLGEHGIFKTAKGAADNSISAEEVATAETKEYNRELGRVLGHSLPKTQDTIPYFPGDEFIKVEGTNLTKGLVITDGTNSWVWIEVPKSIYVKSEYNEGTAPINEKDYNKIESVLKKYTSSYSASSFEDSNYDGTGLTDSEYIALKQKMLESVYTNGGFWIGQYEVGYELAEGQSVRIKENNNYSEEVPLIQTPIIKKGAYPYNWVTVSQAQSLASRINSGEKTSSLMFGIQWDLVLKHLQSKGMTNEELKTNSSSWGNYKNVSFAVDIGAKYAVKDGNKFVWNNIIESYTKPESEVLLTTGASKRNCKFQIYDFTGNVKEWTLEKYKLAASGMYCTPRGGGVDYSGLNYSGATRTLACDKNVNSNFIGLRPTLF